MRINDRTMASRSFLELFDESTKKSVKPQSSTIKNVIITTLATSEEQINEINIKSVMNKVKIIEWILVLLLIPIILIILYKLFNLLKKLYEMHNENIIKKYEKETNIEQTL